MQIRALWIPSQIFTSTLYINHIQLMYFCYVIGEQIDEPVQLGLIYMCMEFCNIVLWT